MCEILDRIENRGINKGIKIGEANMQAEVKALRAEKDTLNAEKNAALAELAHMKELLAKHHITMV